MAVENDLFVGTKHNPVGVTEQIADPNQTNYEMATLYLLLCIATKIPNFLTCPRAVTVPICTS